MTTPKDKLDGLTQHTIKVIIESRNALHLKDVQETLKELLENLKDAAYSLGAYDVLAKKLNHDL